MKAYTLFYDGNGSKITNYDLSESFMRSGAHECKLLYIHSGLSFGAPNPELKKNEILQIILDTIFSLDIPTLCVPTFTFSFCNGQDFDPVFSKSKMGVFNEYFRKFPSAIRSADPLMSVALIGEDHDLAKGIGHESIGKDSTFFKIHNRADVKFLFLGTALGDCFTYMHYIEKHLNVKYRYDRSFTGNIISNGEKHQASFTLFVRYKNIFPGKGSYDYEHILLQRGFAKKVGYGTGFITSVDEPSAFKVYAELIDENPNYFIDPRSIFDNDRTFEVKDMIAL